MARLFIDVREPEEFVTGHVKNALNISITELMRGTAELTGIPKDAELVLYCRTGNRSGLSKSILESKGYTNVINGINKEHIAAHYTA